MLDEPGAVFDSRTMETVGFTLEMFAVLYSVLTAPLRGPFWALLEPPTTLTAALEPKPAFAAAA